MCVTVVAGLGETALLLHLLTNVAKFKEVPEFIGLQAMLSQITKCQSTMEYRHTMLPPSPLVR